MSEKDDIGGEPTTQSLAPQEIPSPNSPTIGGLLKSCGPPSQMFIIDTDDDEIEEDSAQIEQRNDFSDCDARSQDFDDEACDNCKNMELTARKAYESLISYKKQIDKFTSFEKENQQLRNINRENAIYLQELLTTQKKLETKNTEMEAELQYEKRQAESHDTQIKKAYSMLQENQAHIAAANEWRVKYDASQETLKQVHEMRKTYDEKMSDTLKVAQVLQTQLGRAEKKVEKLTDETTGVRARLKYISDYMPLLLSAVDLLLTRFPKEAEIQKRYTRLTEPDVRLVLMGKQITSKALEHAMAQGSTTRIQDLDKSAESAEIEDSLDQDLRLSESEDDELETSFDTKSGFSQKLPARALQPARTLLGTKIEPKSQKKLFSNADIMLPNTSKLLEGNDTIESEDDELETPFDTKSSFSQKLPARALQPARTLLGTKIEPKPQKKLFSNADIMLPNTSTVKLSESNDAIETYGTPSTIHERKMRTVGRQTGLPKAVKNNLTIRPRSIKTLHSPTTSRAIKRNSTTLEVQPLGAPILSKPKYETTQTSVAGLELSASDDDEDDESFDTISPNKRSTNKDMKNISSLEHAEGDPTDVPGVTSTIHGRKMRTVREQQQKMGNISDRIAKLKEDPTFAKASVEAKEIPKDDKNNFTILSRSIKTLHSPTTSRAIKRNSTTLEVQPLGAPILSKPKYETTQTSVAGLELSASDDDDESFDTISPNKRSTNKDVKNISSLEHAEGDPTDVPGVTSTIHGRKMRTVREQQQKMGNISDRIAKLKEDPTFAKASVEAKEIPKDDKNNFTIRPRSIKTLHSPTTSRAIKRNSTTLEVQPLGAPILSKPKYETTQTSVAGLELSASDDDEDDESFGTISPNKRSTNKDVKNISSLEHAEGDPTDVPGVTSTIHGRKTRTVREQQQKMGNISDRIAKLKEDPTFAKATVETKEIPKDDKNNFTILPRTRRSATMAMNAPKSSKGASVSFESPPLDTQIVNKTENEEGIGSSEGIASQINDVSRQDNLDQDLRMSESEDEDMPDTSSGTKRVSFFVKPVCTLQNTVFEKRSPEKLSAPQDTNTPKSPSETLSTEESDLTKTPETIKTTRERKARTPRGQPQITRNVSSRVVKPKEDAKAATNETKEVPKDVKENVITTSRPTRAPRATAIASTKTPRLLRKRNAACIDAQPLDAPITNKPKYMNTPGSITSQIEDMFKKVANGVPLKKASGALSVDLDEAAQILNPPAIATLFIQVLNVTEVGNLWLSLTKSLNAYRQSNEANDLNDAFRNTTAKVELELIQVINQMDLEGELFNEAFNRVSTLIFCQKQPTITQFCRNVRVAFLLLHFNQALSNEEKLLRSRKLIEFMLYERSADLVLSSLCFLCFNEGHKLLDWLRGDDIDAVQRQICSLLTNRSNKTQDYLDILSFMFPNVIFSPLDTEAFSQSWVNGLKALDEEIAKRTTALKLIDGKFEVDNNILNEIEQLLISLPSNTHTLQTLEIPDSLVKDSFAMIEQWIVGATNSTDGGLFSDSTKYNVEVDIKKLNLLCVHLLLAIDIISECVRWKTTLEIRRLMETLKHVDEKVPLLLSRCSQSKMSSECIALIKDILLNWQQSTKMFTEYQ